MQKMILTGGSGGLGKAIIREFSDAIWQITAPSREEMDMRNPQGIRAFMKNRPVDLLICSAGLIQDQLLLKMEESSWDDLLAVNFEGAAECARHALPQMLAAEGGHIIFISSYSALHPKQGQSAYAVAKAGLIGLTSSLSKYYGKHNVRINAILPGFMETQMTQALTMKQKSEILDSHVLGRLNQVENVARFCRFLHESMPDTSGQVFQLDSRPGF